VCSKVIKKEIQMNRTSFVIALVAVFLLHSVARAQSDELPKFEVAGEFTTLERGDFTGRRTDPGVGGRFTYNLNRVFSLEGAGYFFPKGCFSCRQNGRVTEVFGGVKVGKRFDSWGIFAKARPGMISFSEGDFEVVPQGPGLPFLVKTNSLNGFAADVGGVVEFYPSKRIVTRFDVGDTIVHIPGRTSIFFQFVPAPGSTNFTSFYFSRRTSHRPISCAHRRALPRRREARSRSAHN
jgi:hypothetical protein